MSASRHYIIRQVSYCISKECGIAQVADNFYRRRVFFYFLLLYASWHMRRNCLPLCLLLKNSAHRCYESALFTTAVLLYYLQNETSEKPYHFPLGVRTSAVYKKSCCSSDLDWLVSGEGSHLNGYGHKSAGRKIQWYHIVLIQNHLLDFYSIYIVFTSQTIKLFL